MIIECTISVPYRYRLKGESLEAIKNGDYEVATMDIVDEWLVEQMADESFQDCIEKGEYKEVSHE